MKQRVCITILIAIGIGIFIESSLEPSIIMNVRSQATIEEAFKFRPRLSGPFQIPLNPLKPHWSSSGGMYSHDSQSIWITKPGLFGTWQYQRTDFVEESANNIDVVKYRPRLLTFLIVGITICSMAYRSIQNKWASKSP